MAITDPEQVSYILGVIDGKKPLPKDIKTTPFMGGGCVLKVAKNGVVEEYSFVGPYREIVKSDGSSEIESVENVYGIRYFTGDVSTDYTVTTDLSKYLFDKFYK